MLIKKLLSLLILILCSIASLPAFALVTAISFDCGGKATNDLVAGDVVSVVHTFDQTGSFAHAFVRTTPTNQLHSAVGFTNYVAGVPTTVTQTLTVTPAAGTLRFAIQFFADNVLVVCPPSLAALTVIKTIVNDDGGVITDPNDFLLTVDGNAVLHNVSNDFSPDTYTVSETNLAGYAPSAWGGDCAADGTIVLASGDDATCTITNDDIPAELTLVKIVNNTAGGGSAGVGDWTLEANLGGGAAEISGASGVTATISAGDYVLSEVNGPSGYSLTGLSCDAGTLNVDILTVSLDQDIICTFTNEDLIANLEITKTVNDLNPSVGDTITFMLDVVNNGPSDATNVVINDTVLAGFTFVVNSMVGGDTQNQTAPSLVWTINSLPVGAANAVTLTYQAVVN